MTIQGRTGSEADSGLPTIFICYASPDRDWKDRISPQLRAAMGTTLRFEIWDESKIRTGEEIETELTRAIDRATVAVLLISVHFLSDSKLRKMQLDKLRKRKGADGLPLLPLLVGPTSWRKHEWLEELRVRPLDETPLQGRPDKDAEMSSFAEAVIAIADRRLEAVAQRTAVDRIALASSREPRVAGTQSASVDPSRFRDFGSPTSATPGAWATIPPGRVRIGSPEGEAGRSRREGPRFWVTLAEPFRIMATPVTHAQVASLDPSKADLERPDHPAVGLSWHDAMALCRQLAARPGFAGARLPTEVEWEYACRAGDEGPYGRGETEEDLDAAGWFYGNSPTQLSGPQPVARKQANAWGLYDVHGNVWEWTASLWAPDYSSVPNEHSIAPSWLPHDLTPGNSGELGTARVIRGGGAGSSAAVCRAASRDYWEADAGRPDLGFRIVVP